jgi:hypothetical protein
VRWASLWRDAWPRRSPAHRATIGNRRVILAFILAVLTVALVLGALVAITHGIITVPGSGRPPTTTR